MITVRNNTAAPMDLGTLIGPGATGPVDPERPGVRRLIELKRIVVVEGNAGKVDPSAEIAALRKENADLKREKEALAADVGRLSAIVDSLGNAPSKPVVRIDAVDQLVDPAAKQKKGP